MLVFGQRSEAINLKTRRYSAIAMGIDRMLCVDDEKLCRNMLRMYFQESLTPHVDIAEDYNSAMQQIRENEYDLIILDSLGGDCFKIHREIQDIPHGDLIIFSGCYKTQEEAGKMGIPFYHKLGSVSNLDEIVKKYKQPAIE